MKSLSEAILKNKLLKGKSVAPSQKVSSLNEKKKLKGSGGKVNKTHSFPKKEGKDKPKKPLLNASQDKDGKRKKAFSTENEKKRKEGIEKAKPQLDLKKQRQATKPNFELVKHPLLPLLLLLLHLLHLLHLLLLHLLHLLPLHHPLLLSILNYMP